MPKHDMNEAIARAQKLVEQFPDNEMARFSLSKGLFDHGQTAAAKEQFEAALASKLDGMVVQILTCKCELALGNSAAAQVAFERRDNWPPSRTTTDRWRT